jgi:hypothetical protein
VFILSNLWRKLDDLLSTKGTVFISILMILKVCVLDTVSRWIRKIHRSGLQEINSLNE